MSGSDDRKYWKSKHGKYLTQPWIDQPTIFANQVIKYFPKTGRLLDLGAGQGQDSRFFLKNSYDVLCTDFSDFALKIAKEKAKNENLKLKTREVDISKKLPFKDNEFDIVYSHLSLHYWDEDETKEIFKEIYRILKPGGILAAIFNSINDPEIPSFKKVGANLYEEPNGTARSYWSADYLKGFIGDHYEILLLDDKGETHKDQIKCLTRFVGKKI